jgi:PKD repeat protein
VAPNSVGLNQLYFNAADFGGQVAELLHNALVYLAGPPPVDIPWLSETPTSGSVPPGECVVVDVTFDSTGLASGDYFAALLITSNDPDTPEITIPVQLTVLEPATIAGVTYTVTGLQVVFDATVTGAAPLTFAWTFGDGGTSNLEDPTHTYAAGGCYTVTLTVSNECSQDTWQEQICVCAAATGAGFTCAPTAPVVDQTVDFSGSIAAGTPPFTWSWDFGDGTTGSGQYVTHAYAAPGDYLVTLTVANACGQAVAEHTVTVLRPHYYYYLPIITRNYAP